MEFDNEAALQEFISKSLRQLGHENEREVVTAGGNGRIDVLSEKYAIEVKPKLNRSAMFQAAGQVQSYKSSFPGRQLVIAGLAPSGEDAYKSAKNTAQVLEQENGIVTWFVDEMTEFKDLYWGKPEPSSHGSTDRFEFDSFWGRFAIAVFLFFVIAITSVATQNKTPTAITVRPTTPEDIARPVVGRATVTGRFNVRTTPSTADDRNIAETAIAGDILILTGKTVSNQYGNWSEVQGSDGTTAWISTNAFN